MLTLQMALPSGTPSVGAFTGCMLAIVVIDGVSGHYLERELGFKRRGGQSQVALSPASSRESSSYFLIISPYRWEGRWRAPGRCSATTLDTLLEALPQHDYVKPHATLQAFLRGDACTSPRNHRGFGLNVHGCDISITMGKLTGSVPGYHWLAQGRISVDGRI